MMRLHVVSSASHAHPPAHTHTPRTHSPPTHPTAPTHPVAHARTHTPASAQEAPNAKKRRYSPTSASKEEADHLYPHPARHACVGAAAPSARRRGPLAYGANGSGIVGDQSLRVELIAKPALGRSSSARAAHAPAAGVESQPAAAAAELEASQCMRAVALTLCKLSEAFGEWAGRSDASSSANAAKCVGEAVGIAEEPPRAPAAAVAEVAVVATVGGAAGERPCAVVTDETAVPPTNIAAAGLGSSLDAVGKAHVADTPPYGGGAAQVVCWAPFCSVVDTLHAVRARHVAHVVCHAMPYVSYHAAGCRKGVLCIVPYTVAAVPRRTQIARRCGRG